MFRPLFQSLQIYTVRFIPRIYVSDLKSKEVRPQQELKGFDKVWLEPKESKVITFTLSKEAFQYFSEKQRRWVFEPGIFNLRIGASSRDIRLVEEVKL